MLQGTLSEPPCSLFPSWPAAWLASEVPTAWLADSILAEIPTAWLADSILIGDVDGRLVILESIEGVWGMTREMSENKEGIIDIDTDGKWAATGTRQSILLWDLEEHKMVENIKEVKTMVWML